MFNRIKPMSIVPSFESYNQSLEQFSDIERFLDSVNDLNQRIKDNTITNEAYESALARWYHKFAARDESNEIMSDGTAYVDVTTDYIASKQRWKRYEGFMHNDLQEIITSDEDIRTIEQSTILKHNIFDINSTYIGDILESKANALERNVFQTVNELLSDDSKLDTFLRTGYGYSQGGIGSYTDDDELYIRLTNFACHTFHQFERADVIIDKSRIPYIDSNVNTMIEQIIKHSRIRAAKAIDIKGHTFYRCATGYKSNNPIFLDGTLNVSRAVAHDGTEIDGSLASYGINGTRIYGKPVYVRLCSNFYFALSDEFFSQLVESSSNHTESGPLNKSEFIGVVRRVTPYNYKSIYANADIVIDSFGRLAHPESLLAGDMNIYRFMLHDTFSKGFTKHVANSLVRIPRLYGIYLTDANDISYGRSYSNVTASGVTLADYNYGAISSLSTRSRADCAFISMVVKQLSGIDYELIRHYWSFYYGSSDSFARNAAINMKDGTIVHDKQLREAVQEHKKKSSFIML